MRKVAIVGLGTVNPLGNDAETFWAGIKAGKSGIGRITKFDPEAMDSKIAGEVRNFDPTAWMDKKDARKMALFSQYGVASAVQAWRDAGLPDPLAVPEGTAPTFGPDSYRTGIWLGNGIGGMEIFEDSHAKLLQSGPRRMPPLTVPLMIMNEAAGNIALRLKVRGPAVTIATACASGTDAIGQAWEAIRTGRVDRAIAGGTEACIAPFAIGGFCMLKTLSTKRNDDPEKASRPFDADRDGFVIGEGAGILVLEELESAKARGARIYALLAGYGASCDAYHLTAPDPEGSAGVEAIRTALREAGLAPEDIDYYNAHGTSTEINDPMETGMIKKAFGEHAKKLKVSSTKSMTGHLVAAAGAVEAIACVLAIRDSFYPPTINLDNPDPLCDLDYVPNAGQKGKIRAAASGSLGFGGHNGVLVFSGTAP
jgi:3-oxoacyl-[acyl-carrier-protein] synthase II